MGLYNLSVEIPNGEEITLTDNSKYTLISVDGLAPPNAAINVAVNANFDGSNFISSRMNERNIVIQFAIESDVEENRIALYKVFKPKHQVRVRYENGTRNVFIDGYVESFECNFFAKKETAQISIICPYPYFLDENNVDFSFTETIPNFEFPFDIDSVGIEFSTIIPGEEKNVINNGDVETGMLISFTAIGAVVNPVLYNTVTGEKVKVNIEMQSGDLLEVNTTRGKKSVILNKTTNKINDFDKTSTWLQLQSGDNLLMTDATSGATNLMCNVTYENLYGGV